jgi:hypothetical protein
MLGVGGFFFFFFGNWKNWGQLNSALLQLLIETPRIHEIDFLSIKSFFLSRTTHPQRSQG